MNIDEMDAGPELDRLVAEKVMGCEPCGHPFCGPRTGHNMPAPYSTDIRAAWEVVDKLGLFVGKGFFGWIASQNSYWLDSETCTADTAPLAICRAALKACGVSK